MIKENLGAFKEHKFFTLLEQFGNEQKEQEKERQKGKDKDKSKPKQKNDQQKEAAQAAKDAMDVVKKAIDNFNRFKSFAGSQIEEYKKFWSMQKSVCGKFTKSGMCYALFNDGSSDKYKPLYVVSIEAVEGKPCLCVFKTTLEEGDENPVFAIRNPQAEKEFKGFLNDMKRSLKEVKDKYVQTVEAKKKEEENKKKRERLDKFLKESKSSNTRRVFEGESPMDDHAVSKGFSREKIKELSNYARSIDTTGEGDIDVNKWFAKAKQLFGIGNIKELADIYAVDLTSEIKQEWIKHVKNEFLDVLSYISDLTDQENNRDEDSEDEDYDFDEESLEIYLENLGELIDYDEMFQDMFDDIKDYELNDEWVQSFEKKYSYLLDI